MFESKDIFFIVLAFCALWFTVFLCWFLYQLAVVLKHLNDAVQDVRLQFAKLEGIGEAIRERFEHHTSQFGSMAENIKSAVENWRTRE